MVDPYRDENETLRAENARLRARLLSRRGGRGRTLSLLALDFVAIIFLRPWLNGASDAKFWGGVAVVAGIALAALVSGIIGSRRN
jgi:hypothetical protein